MFCARSGNLNVDFGSSAASRPERCDSADDDGDTSVDGAPAGGNWDLDGGTVKDCLDASVDTDGDGVVNTVDADDDGDGFTDARARKMSTDELGACPSNSSHDAWSPDGQRDIDVDVGDVISLYFNKILTKCAVFTFANGTGVVDDIHIQRSGPIAEVFSARDSDLRGWSNRTISGGGLTLDIHRPDAQGDSANGGQLTIIVRAVIPVPAVSSCQWTLDGANKGAC